jgi:hypothetical protein
MHLGYRQRTLLLSGVAFAGFGVAVLLDARNAPSDAWLPATALTAALATDAYAAIWLGLGAVLLGLGWWPPADRWLFALAAGCTASWTASYVVHAVRYHRPGDWSSVASSVAVVALLLLVAAWPEPAP